MNAAHAKSDGLCQHCVPQQQLPKIDGASGMIGTSAPLAVGTIAARYVLKMSPLMTLGGLAGAQTCRPGLNALREACDSNIGSLAYTVPYAIGNILLTVWGAVVVAIVQAMRG